MNLDLREAYATLEKELKEDGEPLPMNVLKHRALCEEINRLYKRKNHDYGNSFSLSYQEEGMAMVRIRLTDKLNRFKILTRSNNAQMVNDESIRDTLIDLANYALMAVMEIDEGEKKRYESER